MKKVKKKKKKMMIMKKVKKKMKIQKKLMRKKKKKINFSFIFFIFLKKNFITLFLLIDSKLYLNFSTNFLKQESYILDIIFF